MWADSECAVANESVSAAQQCTAALKKLGVERKQDKVAAEDVFVSAPLAFAKMLVFPAHLALSYHLIGVSLSRFVRPWHATLLRRDDLSDFS